MFHPFHPFKRSLPSKRLASPLRTMNLRVRPSIERLEDRALLSVNMGPMPHAAGPSGMPPQHFGGPEPYGAGMFAPPPNDGHHVPMPGIQSYGMDSYGFGPPPRPQMR